ncbi:MAG: polyprenyl synthetase family protein [Acidobacteria bacterium]|nr:polyprenyl synthetase family protein [Acidobacteriota bacterium]MCB9398850.1 polyprenyl synthetase family protein [Acidobacteriota bacterium]
MPSAPFSIVDAATWETFSQHYRDWLPNQPHLEWHLAGVLAWVNQAKGSMVRAQLILAIMENAPQEQALRCAVAVEYFHTASLLLDDLPCMDQAQERRGLVCAHLQYGESAAILGALALINRAYGLLWQSMANLKPAQATLAAKVIERSLGTAGLLQGQAIDLHFAQTNQTALQVTRAAMGKTVPLIRMAVVLPLILVNATSTQVQEAEKLSTLWGLAYQVMDDIKDVSGDFDGKTGFRDEMLGRPNFALATSIPQAWHRFLRLLFHANRILTNPALNANLSCLKQLQDYLNLRAQTLYATKAA